MEEDDGTQRMHKTDEGASFPVVDESEVSMTILKVVSKMSQNLIQVRIKNNKTGELEDVWMSIPTEYTELLTEDLSTANLKGTDSAVCSAHANLCSHIKSFADKRGLKFTRSHNRFANNHNYFAVQSKAENMIGAQMAKTYHVQQKIDKREAFTESKSKKKGLFGIFE